MIGNSASIYGSYMYQPKAAPLYKPAGAGLAVVALFCAAMALLIHFTLRNENRKLAKAEVEGLQSPGDVNVVKGFRYIT